MKRERIAPCKKHPKAFWPWDRPFLRMTLNYRLGLFAREVLCPMCEDDRRRALCDAAIERENLTIREWNKANEA